MASRIAIIQGHPDPAPERFCRALAEAYAAGAAKAGHEARRIDVAALEFPLIRNQAQFERGAPPPAIADAQETLRWADHWVIIYPLWLGDAPALFKAFIEQTFRPGFALRYRDGRLPEGLLKGKSARVIVTMGMPAPVYRFFFFAHGLRNLKRNVLNYAGVRPVRATLIGSVKGMGRETAEKWLETVGTLGSEGR
ncbi:MAG: NAD(P)H-dependent oxidoreductase [Methylocystis sp.]|uniref:NAD(P)H-dependent oxidoreductase n=1 Tax=Methylocystis sp. TaxID=1911079 RepID=UPI003DA62004